MTESTSSSGPSDNRFRKQLIANIVNAQNRSERDLSLAQSLEALPKVFIIVVAPMGAIWLSGLFPRGFLTLLFIGLAVALASSIVKVLPWIPVYFSSKGLQSVLLESKDMIENKLVSQHENLELRQLVERTSLRHQEIRQSIKRGIWGKE